MREALIFISVYWAFNSIILPINGIMFNKIEITRCYFWQ